MPQVERHPSAEQQGKVIVQSVLLPLKWPEAKAKRWLREHGYYFGEPELSEDYWRARQFNPSDFVRNGMGKSTFVVFELPDSGGVKLIRGKVK